MRLGDDELGRLGMADNVARLFGDALAERDGLILIAGPEGSGRLATIAAAIARNPGATATLEIIDDAAEAMQAASPGRLVLAPIRAGHAVGAIARLRALRVDPLSIAATVRASVAQRSARRLCAACREPIQAIGNVSALLGFDPGTLVYRARGCGECEGTGFRGRIGLFEIVRVEGAIRRLIGMDGDEAVIASHAFRDSPNLSGAARHMVRDGLIAADEAVALSRSPMLEAA